MGEGGLYPQRSISLPTNSMGIIAIEVPVREVPNPQAGLMKYVYILESVDGEHFYVGIADDVSARLTRHNAGEVPHTSKYRPWRVRTYIAFTDESLACASGEK